MKLYKPSRSNKGYAFSINFSARTDKFDDNNRLVKGDKSFYIQMVRQNGFNEKTGNGIFKDGYKVIVKIAPHEAAAMIAAINRNISMAEAMNTKYVYHDGAESATTVVFEPYFKSEKRGDQWIKSNVQSGFIFKVTKVNKSNEQEKENLGIAFNWGETELLKTYLSHGLFSICDAWKGENIGRAKNKVLNQPKVQEPVAPDPEPEVVEVQGEEDFFNM